MILHTTLLILILISFMLAIVTISIHIKWRRLDNYVEEILKTVNSVRYGNLTTKLNKTRLKKYQKLTNSINRMIEALSDREHMIAEYQSEMIKQNNLLESVVNSLSDGIIVTNENGKIINSTPKIKLWLGQDNIEGKNVFDYLSFNNKKLDNLNQEELFIKESSANSFIVSSQKIETENTPLYILIIKDVTKEHEIETLKEDFVATLTHDLKVPIVAESNVIEFLLNGKFGDINEKQRYALNNMQSSNKELLDLVQIVLETYKLKDQGITLIKENICVNEFLRNIIAEMQPIGNHSDITIYYSPEQKIYVNADKIQLTRVLKNIISNAISHSNTKERIDINSTQNNGMIEISVTDYGQGINEEEVKMIFNKYYSATNKFRKIGTGLGLYLSQQIIQSHGGEITVKSEENVKTEFLIKIPA